MNRNKGNVRDELRRTVFSLTEFENSIEFHYSINLEDLKDLSQKLKNEIGIKILEKIKSIKKEDEKEKEREKLLNSLKIRIGIDDCEGLKF